MSLLKLNDTSYDKIDNYYKDELNDINEAQKNILDYIKTQGEKVDTINTKIDNINTISEHSYKDLRTANNYSISYSGIILSGLTCGIFITPFGFLLGLKAGLGISSAAVLAGTYASYKLQKIE